MDRNRNITGAVIGIILILIGLFALFGQNLVFWNAEYLWPLIVVGLGAAFLITMLVGDKSLGGLAINMSTQAHAVGTLLEPYLGRKR